MDLDFKLLSEYLFDDNVMTQQAAPKLTKKVDRRVSARDEGICIRVYNDLVCLQYQNDTITHVSLLHLPYLHRSQNKNPPRWYYGH